MEKTKVTFRKLDGNIIALFPEEVSYHGGKFIASYEHYGQHGDTSVDGIVEWERAEPDEYADLLAELRVMGYDLEVVG